MAANLGFQPQLRKVAAHKTPGLMARKTDELVIALVGPIGAGCTTTAKCLEDVLKSVYEYEKVFYYKVSSVIVDAAATAGRTVNAKLEKAERAMHLQDLGNGLRSQFGNQYLAAKVIKQIAITREDNAGFEESSGGVPVAKPKRWCHIIDSLKNPDELRLLREVYGDMLWVFGVTAPEKLRRDRLRDDEGWDEKQLSALFERDFKEDVGHGQGVRDTFYQSDFYIRNDGQNDVRLNETVGRHLEVIFGKPVRTPSVDESSMYTAYAAASRSACLSRQVGAAIVSLSGEVIGIGWNDVPKFGGGLYSAEDEKNDHRCYKWSTKICHNDHHKNSLYTTIFSSLKAQGFLSDSASEEKIIQTLKKTDISQIIEYSRAVHAEMTALISVARGNKAGLDGAVLYCTTFPCHSCARHLLAAGISKVVYIEPYAKSLATNLHRDAITANDRPEPGVMGLEQYEGVAPRNLLRLFKIPEVNRKRDGMLVEFDPAIAHPLGAISVEDFSVHEKRVIAVLTEVENPPVLTDK